MKRILLIIIILLAISAIWYGYSEYNRTNTNLTNAKATALITAATLLSAFEHDSASAVKQFDDKIIAVSGPVKKIEAVGKPVIIFLGDAVQLSSVQCSMDSTNVDAYKVLKTGITTTLKGQVAGFR